MRPWFLAIFCLSLACASAAASPVPLATLSLQERQVSAPASTMVQVGRRTVPLGLLRAAHRLREADLVRARAAGFQIGATLKTGRPVVVRAGVARAPLGAVFATPPIVEPPSQYAAAPSDMKAFCESASASACLYLPPGQQVSPWPGGYVADFDVLIDQAQCQSEGGTWAGLFGSQPLCSFYYPSSVVVHFDPAANYQIASTASCAAMWSYQADARGAVSIQLLPQFSAGPFQTGGSAACVVRVTVG
jgi:hypothetical protein